MSAAVESPLAAYAEACTRSGCRQNKTFTRELESLPSTATLDCIDLSVNVVGKNGANAIVDLVAAAPGVTRLLLRDNYLANENVLYLVQRLVAHPSLTTVDLRNNPISHAAGKALLRFVHANRRITAIALDGTLINRALIRMISSAAEANAQAPAEEAAAADSVVAADGTVTPAQESAAADDPTDAPAAADVAEAPAAAAVAEAPAAVVTAEEAASQPAPSAPLTPRERAASSYTVLQEIARSGAIPPAVACILACAGIRRRDTSYSVLAALQVAASSDPRPSADDISRAPLNALWAAAFYTPATPAPTPAATAEASPAAEELPAAADADATAAPASSSTGAGASSSNAAAEEDAEQATDSSTAAAAAAPPASGADPAPAASEIPKEDAPAATDEAGGGTEEYQPDDRGLALILQTAIEAGSPVTALECVVEGGAIARRLPVLAAIAAVCPSGRFASVDALLDASVGTHERARGSPVPDAQDGGAEEERAANAKYPLIATLATTEPAGESSTQAALVEASQPTPREEPTASLQLVLLESSAEHAGLGLLVSLL